MFVRSLLVSLPLCLAACRDDASQEPLDGDVSEPADAGVDAEPGPHPGEVWVMTWNLQLFPKTAGAPARVAEVLAGRPVDLVAVQEIDDVAAFTALDEALPAYTGLIASDALAPTRVGLLYRQDQVQISEVRTLFGDDPNAFPRPPLVVHARAQGIDFTVVVLHLKAFGDEGSEARRRDAVAKLDAWMDAERAAGADPDVVVLGDWNDELTKPAGDNVFTLLLEQPERYTFLTLPLEEAGGTGTYIPNPGFLDHILVTTDALDEWGDGSTEVLRLDDEIDDYVDDVTDHRPVLTKFRP
jgi:endonuclease/exonuclease/phosphatase family metal-dependent hydrolase